MNVEDGLSGAGAGVEDETILAVTVLVGELLHYCHEFGKERGITRRQLRDVSERFGFRHHKQVNRSLRRDVSKRDDPLILKDDIRRDLARNNPREDGGLGCYRHG